MVMNCKNCNRKCGAVEGFEPPFCCIACNNEWHVKLEEKMRRYENEY